MDDVTDLNQGDRRGSGHRARRRLAMLAPAAAVLALAGIAPGSALAAGSGTITGTVTLPGSADASEVTATLLDPSGASMGTASVSAGSSANTATYTFTSVTPGQYEIFFSTPTADNVADGYYSSTVAAGVDSVAQATAVTAADGQTTTDQATTLVTGATIAGTVSDADAATNTTETVTACPVNYFVNAVYPDPGFACPSATVTTGTGAYAVTGLPAGTYNLTYTLAGTNTALGAYDYSGWVATSGLTQAEGNASQFTVTAGGSASASFSVAALGGVGGTVTGPGGTPLQDFDVQVYNPAGVLDTGAKLTHTAGADTFTVDAVPGTYTLEISSSTDLLLAPTFESVTIAAGQLTPLTVSLAQSGTITGTVTAARGGADLGGIPVTLVSSDAEDVPLLTLTQTVAEDISTVTQADGTYTLSGVPAGTWYVEFDGGLAYNGLSYAAQFYGGKPDLFGAKKVTVTSAATTKSVNAALLPASVSALAAPKLSFGGLGGLNTGKGTLRFRIAAGANAGYVHSFVVTLPAGITFVSKNLKKDLSLGGKPFTYTLKSKKLTVTFTTAEPSATLTLKAGGLTDTRAIEKLAKARKIKTETVHVLSTDTTGLASSLSYVVKKPA